jgi:hypothetical protein
VIALLLSALLAVATASDDNPLDLSNETELGRLEPGDPFPDIEGRCPNSTSWPVTTRARESA